MSQETATDIDSPAGSRSLTLTGRQQLAVVLGLMLIMGGLVVILLPGAPTVAPELLNVVGILTLISFVYFGVLWTLLETTTVESPDVDRRTGLEPAGESFEQSIERRYVTDEELVPALEANIRNELRHLGVELLERNARSNGDSVGTLAEGSWTDDDIAAAFLESQETTPDQRTQSQDYTDDTGAQERPATGFTARLKRRIRRMPLVPRVTPFEARVKRTVQALATVGGVETDTDPEWGQTRDTRPDTWQEGITTTSQWRGLAGFAVVTLGIGVLFRVSGLVLVAGLLLGVVGFSRVTTPPELSLSVERRLDTTHPAPGDPVTVTVSVTNDGDSILPDIRLIDGVPDRLAVDEGTPRHATALRPGESVTLEYDVLAVYGDHTFDSIHVAARSSSGHQERRETLSTDRATLACEPGVIVDEVPLHPAASNITGHVRSETGGTGQEFRSVREYRRGDPLRRVDWNRLARTGELASLQFTEEQAGTVVLVIDARPVAFKSPSPGSLSSLDRSLAGASQLFSTLDGDGDRVGLVGLSSDLLWIPPGAGPEHRSRMRGSLKNEAIFEGGQEGRAVETSTYVEQLRRRLPSDAQLIVFSPLLDDTVVDTIRQLRAYGYETTVFSPDPTSTESIGSTVERLRRDIRLESLRRADVPLVDWNAKEGLDVAVGRAERWQL